MRYFEKNYNTAMLLFIKIQQRHMEQEYEAFKLCTVLQKQFNSFDITKYMFSFYSVHTPKDYKALQIPSIYWPSCILLLCLYLELML